MGRIHQVLHYRSRNDHIKILRTEREMAQITANAKRRAGIGRLQCRLQVDSYDLGVGRHLFREFEIATAPGIQEAPSRRKILVDHLPVERIVELAPGVVPLIKLFAFLSISRSEHMLLGYGQSFTSWYQSNL